MRPPTKWFERKFTLDLPLDYLPVVIERLRGTPARLEERLKGLSLDQRVKRIGESWSIQEHAGHLLDLEALWLGRIADFRVGEQILCAADLQNRKTYNADHNSSDIQVILRDFRLNRAQLVHDFESWPENMLGITALHPRLGQPMRLIDHAFFVAEHDHHLAMMTSLII